MTMASPAIEVAAGLVFRGGKLLITQRPAESHLGGLWEFPGGKRENGETFEQCLSRELREELGIEVQIHELVEAVTHTYAEKTVILKFFRCSVRLGEPRAIGCPAFRWVDVEELREYRFPDADIKLLDLLTRRTDLWIS